MSVDVLFSGAAVGAQRVAEAWSAIEQAFGSERVEALEDAGLSIAWGADQLELSLPYGVPAADFDALVDLTASELGDRFAWEAQ